ncbi:MAG: hypothetical protein NTY37_12995 [Methanothrix sp.]|nr:hypothetical protein [Methanothrix sp.]
MFFKTSRYQSVGNHQIMDREGRTILYKKIRFIPPPKAAAVHTVREGERLDHIAHSFYRDPERFWAICDANYALWPDDLVARPGRRILIPHP